MNPLELTNSDLAISKNHISNVSNNIVNLSQNRSAALSISYISYFYHLFPLHVNSFNRLFSDVIIPKLSILISSVTQFTCLTTDIPEFKSKLEDVSSYLKNYNPAQSLLNSMESFNGDSYVRPVREDIDKMIKELEGKLNYEQIIDHIYSIVKTYNESLKRSYDNFKNEVKKQQSSLKENIQKYIKKINENLSQQSSCVDKLNELMDEIESEILKFNNNYSIIYKSNYYTSTSKIITLDSSLEYRDLSNIISKRYTLLETLVKYINASSIFNTHKSRLERVMSQLKSHSKQIDKAFKFDELNSESINISPIMYHLGGFNNYLNEFEKNIRYVNKLEEVGKHIKTMKQTLNELKQVEHKVKKEIVKTDFKEYINGLFNINLTQSQVEEKIKKIKEMNNSEMVNLQITKFTIDFYRSLKNELEKLNNMKISILQGHEFNGFSKNPRQIFLTLNQTSETIRKIISQINQVKQKHDYLSLYIPNEFINDPREFISEFKTSLDKSSGDFELINFILDGLQKNKKQSETHISNIKSEVCKLCELSDATTKLTQTLQELKNYVKLQEDTKSLIEKYKSVHLRELSQYSPSLLDSISILYTLISYTELSKSFLEKIKIVDSMIEHICSCYKSKFRRIKQILDNFKQYVDKIISKLETIKCDLLRLKCDIDKCCTGYNKNTCNGDNSCNTSTQANPNGSYDLYKLKDYINNLKFYLSKIKTDFTTIKVFLEKIKEDSSYIDQNKCELKSLEKVIDSYIQSNNNKEGPLKSVMDYLKEIKIRINVIPKVKSLIMEPSNMTKIAKIGCNLNSVDQSISDLECAIEAVVRNTIRCSLKSLSNHLTNFTSSIGGGVNTITHLLINYSLLNITNYNSVINRLFEMIEKTDGMLSMLNRVEFCQCLTHYNRGTKSDLRLSHGFKFTHEYSHSKFHINPVMPNYGNHFCLCIVINYILYPTYVKAMCNLVDSDLDTLSTTSRKYDKYRDFNWINTETLKGLIMLIDLIEVISKIINEKLTCSCKDLMCKCVRKYESRHVSTGSDHVSYTVNELEKWFKFLVDVAYKVTYHIHQGIVPNLFRCYCMYNKNKWYKSLVSIILWVSSLIENIWAMDNSIVTAIQSLSSLCSELKRYDFNSIDIDNLNQTIKYLLNFKSQLPNYIKFLSNHYKLCHESLMKTIESFKCIKSCVESMLKQINGDNGNDGTTSGKNCECGSRKSQEANGGGCNEECQSIKSVKWVFEYISYSENITDTFDYININNPSDQLRVINEFLAKMNESKDISKTTKMLLDVKNYLTWVSWYINENTNRIYWYLITPLSELLSAESVIEKNLQTCSKTSSIYCKYKSIKLQVNWCKSSLESEVRKLQSISSDAKILEKNLDLIIKILKRYKTNEKKLCKFKKKCQQKCSWTSKKCKVCVCGKSIYIIVKITLDLLRYELNAIIKHLMVDTIKLGERERIPFVKNSYINVNIETLRITKNNYSNFNTYTDHKNIANRFPSLTMGYGYESVYDH